MKFKSANSNPRVPSSNSRVMSSTLQVTSSNLRVTCLKPQVTISNPRVTSSNPRVTSSSPRVTTLNPQVMSSQPRKIHIQKYIIPRCIGIEMLFSSQIFTRNIKKIKSGVINFSSRRNFIKKLNVFFLWTF